MVIPKETVGAKIRNKLVIPSTVLQLIKDGKKVSMDDIGESIDALNETVELTKQTEN